MKVLTSNNVAYFVVGSAALTDSINEADATSAELLWAYGGKPAAVTVMATSSSLTVEFFDLNSDVQFSYTIERNDTKEDTDIIEDTDEESGFSNVGFFKVAVASLLFLGIGFLVLGIHRMFKKKASNGLVQIPKTSGTKLRSFSTASLIVNHAGGGVLYKSISCRQEGNFTSPEGTKLRSNTVAFPIQYPISKIQ